MELLYLANRRFDPASGDAWTRYIAWSGLSQLREIVSLDEMLCPLVPEELTREDWDHNVHADHLVFHFRSLEYLRRRVAGVERLNLLAVAIEPSPDDLDAGPAGFSFVGLDVVDVQGGVSALTNCGSYPDVFSGSELSDIGLLRDHARAFAIRDALRSRHADDPHANCHVWAIWRANDSTHLQEIPDDDQPS